MNGQREHVNEHISRCIECYGMPTPGEYESEVERVSLEQMRVDLMLAIGMLMALASLPKQDEKE